MKRFLIAILALGALVSTGEASEVVYTNQLVAETGLAYNNTYVLDLNLYRIDYLSMESVYSSATIPAATFTDGTASTASITISSLTVANLTPTRGQNIITIVNNGLAQARGSDIVRVSSNTTGALNGSTLTIAGVNLRGNIEWTVGNTSSNTATSIAAAINLKVPNVTAAVSPAAGSSVTITCAQLGAFCNTYAVTSTTQAALTVATSSMSAGSDNAVVTLGGRKLTQGTEWTVGNVSSNTAVSLKNAVNAMSGSPFIASTNTTTSVLVKCTATGTFCNATTASVNTSSLTLTGATFASGTDNSFVMINGITLTQGTDWTNQSTASGTARAISNAIQANSVLAALVSSTWTTQATTNFGVVTATATHAGANSYGLYAFPPAYFTLPHPYFFGGTASGVITASSQINVTNHRLTRALPVLFTKTAGTPPGLLVVGTTYYAVPVDANNFKLSSTSTGAVAGTPLVGLSTQTLTGGGSFTFTPLAITGTPSFKWQASNDNTNWTDLSVSSVTVASPYTAGSTSWDFGRTTYRYMRVNVVAPTTGGLSLTVTGYGTSHIY